MRTLISLAVLCSLAVAQPKTQPPAEALAEIPALNDFHEVIAQIWHTAWPEKNATMLVELLPEVEKGSEAVAKARLPAILHEREAAWRKGVTELQKTVADYQAATDPLSASALLAAAEKLHTQYERLVRTIRPALKEIDDFHRSLYLLYHHASPEKDVQRIHVLVGELQEKMAKLSAARLPARLQERSKEFEAARTALAASVEKLYAAVPGGTTESLKPLIEDMHGKYQDLDKVFQ